MAEKSKIELLRSIKAKAKKTDGTEQKQAHWCVQKLHRLKMHLMLLPKV